MAVKIAIVGLSQTTHDDAPWGNPDWEIWGLPWDEGYWPFYDRLFEMHDIKLLENASCRPKNYLDRLKELDQPLYMQKSYFDNATEFPFWQFKRKYWNSSISYALSLSLREADEIGLWGVDMKAEDEYAYQRPNIEYWLGIAEGKGIKVHIPEASPILKFQGKGIYFGNSQYEYKDRYGWLGES